MNLKIASLKYLDFILGKPLIYLSMILIPGKNLINPQLDDKNFLKGSLKILLIRPGGIGDAALLLPSIELLKKRFPDCSIDVMAEKRNYGILEACDHIDEILLYDSRPVRTLKKVLYEGYDIVIDTEQWHRLTSFIAYLSRAPVRIGYGTNERANLYTHTLPYSHNKYEAEMFLNLISILTAGGNNFEKDSTFISLPAIEETENSRRFNQFKNKYHNIVGIFTGATVRERKWGAERFSSVANKLINDEIGIVVLGGRTEIQDSRRIGAILGRDKYLDLTAKTSLKETTRIISGLNLFLSADSGLMHIAYGLGIPTLSLFGAGIKQKWAPPGQQNNVIDKELPCSPCTKFGYTPRCNINVECLNQITVDEVYNSCTRILGMGDQVK